MLLTDRCEETTNEIGGVVGYRITLDEKTTRRAFEIIDGQECFDFCPAKVEEQITPLLIPEEVKTFADVRRVMQGG